jgi:quinol monooxygenase YgiN
MIVVLAKVSVNPEKKTAFLALAKEVIAATQAEEGCVSYVLYDNPYDPGGCMFVEECADKASLKRHLASPHIAEWRKKSAEYLVGKTALKLYQGEETTL